MLIVILVCFRLVLYRRKPKPGILVLVICRANTMLEKSLMEGTRQEREERKGGKEEAQHRIDMVSGRVWPRSDHGGGVLV